MLSQEFYETDLSRGFVRGYDLQITGVTSSPLPTALGGIQQETVPWGEDHHRIFGERFGHTIGITVMTEDLPEEHNQVTLDPNLTDSHGIPAPKIEYKVSENTDRMLDHGVERAKEVLGGGRGEGGLHVAHPAQRRLASAGHGADGRRPQ